MSFAENPIINSPFEKPEWHFELDADGQPTGKKLPGRRNSVYVVPVAASRRRGPNQRELALFEEEGGTRVHENALVNEIRKHVGQWRELPPRQWGVTPETQRLLLHWSDPWRERKLFFCQREAVETLIWLLSSAPGSIFLIEGYSRGAMIESNCLGGVRHGQPLCCKHR